MSVQEVIENGRKYKAHVSPDAQAGAYIIIGPPDVVDQLGLPEPFATRLHNILYERGIMTAKEATRPNVIQGALQEAYLVDAQKLVEAYFNFEKESVTGGSQ
jgi:hypothetical protein